MINYFEFECLKRISKINYILLCLFITLSLTSHLIAYRFTELWGIVLLPSSLTYMACFTIIDILSTFNSAKFMRMVVILEAIANFIMVSITKYVSFLPYPDDLLNNDAYLSVYSSLFYLFLANILGSFIAFLFNSIIFMYFFKRKKRSFIVSSLFSSFSVITIYTIVTDYFAFVNFYKEQVFNLTLINIFSNLLFIFLMAYPARIIVIKIIKYINSGE